MICGINATSRHFFPTAVYYTLVQIAVPKCNRELILNIELILPLSNLFFPQFTV